jgi:hypothetical protein
MKPEGPLQSSQQPTTGPYPEPLNLIHTFTLYFFKNHFNIILQEEFSEPNAGMSSPNVSSQPRQKHGTNFRAFNSN